MSSSSSLSYYTCRIRPSSASFHENDNEINGMDCLPRGLLGDSPSWCDKISLSTVSLRSEDEDETADKEPTATTAETDDGGDDDDDSSTVERSRSIDWDEFPYVICDDDDISDHSSDSDDTSSVVSDLSIYSQFDGIPELERIDFTNIPRQFPPDSTLQSTPDCHIHMLDDRGYSPCWFRVNFKGCCRPEYCDFEEEEVLQFCEALVKVDCYWVFSMTMRSSGLVTMVEGHEVVGVLQYLLALETGVYPYQRRSSKNKPAKKYAWQAKYLY